MKYIWINPVTAAMYEPAALQKFLEKHAMVRVDASACWLEKVKEKYQKAIESSKKTVIDVRCPKITSLIHSYDLLEQITIPDIEPILLHCGREISERKELLGIEKIITTPCQSLAELGNSLDLEDTTFLPWNQLLSSLDDMLAASLPKESPIPPGFFDDISCSKISVTGKMELCKFFENFEPDKYHLVELLYCRDGCHNGDGICTCK